MDHHLSDVYLANLLGVDFVQENCLFSKSTWSRFCQERCLFSKSTWSRFYPQGDYLTNLPAQILSKNVFIFNFNMCIFKFKYSLPSALGGLDPGKL